MIELHERLSEYSYGYGVTREVERLLNMVGVRTVPFLPDLVHEGEVAFDVGFHGPGRPLLLQFKLGQSLRRFHRSDPADPIPPLTRPFFRFTIDTAEPDGQFETLLKAEHDGAEVYYAAPRFADWPFYISLFQNDAVLSHSVLITPQEIRGALDSNGVADGRHRIVYDENAVHVCSRPIKIRQCTADDMATSLVERIRTEEEPLNSVLKRVYVGLEERVLIRRGPPRDAAQPVAESLGERMATARVRALRGVRLANLQERSRSPEDALAAALGLELWGLGIQLLFAVEKDNP